MNALTEHFPKINTDFSKASAEAVLTKEFPDGIIEATERCFDAISRLNEEMDELDIKSRHCRTTGADEFTVKFVDRPGESVVSTLLRTIEHRIQVATDRVVFLSKTMDM